MRVSEVMEQNVATCSVGATLSDAARIMWERDLGFVPVVDRTGESVVGVVTDRDIAMAGYIRGCPLSQIPVDAAMAKTVYSCDPNDDLARAEAIMGERQVRRLPVMRGAKLLGVISLNDLARAALDGQDVSPVALSRTLGAICRPRRELRPERRQPVRERSLAPSG